MGFIKKVHDKWNDLWIIYGIRKKNPGINKSVKYKEPANLVLGDNCRIGENSYLLCWNEYSFGKLKQNLKGTITIGNNFSATRNLTIQSCNSVFIGNDVLVASNVFICDYNHGILNTEGSYLDNLLTLSRVSIEDGVWIGQGAYVLPGVRIGKNSILGAGSVAVKDIPEYCMAVGNPAKIVKRYDRNLGKWISIN
ncbi:acyltransferase [Lacrimispora indolis]|uniref:acyltransferase n=1 Tax=Lacrimispora indolis TaxID=69825 RepID=UPI00045E9624|nr:acyltransferase [Lacrimispora indolis]